MKGRSSRVRRYRRANHRYSMTSKGRLLLAALLMSGFLASREMEPPGLPSVANRSDVTVDVYLVGEGNEGVDTKVFTLNPGLGLELPGDTVGDCIEHELLALDEAGNEIERRPPGLCEGDVWFVNGDPSD